MHTETQVRELAQCCQPAQEPEPFVDGRILLADIVSAGVLCVIVPDPKVLCFLGFVFAVHCG